MIYQRKHFIKRKEINNNNKLNVYLDTSMSKALNTFEEETFKSYLNKSIDFKKNKLNSDYINKQSSKVKLKGEEEFINYKPIKVSKEFYSRLMNSVGYDTLEDIDSLNINIDNNDNIIKDLADNIKYLSKKENDLKSNGGKISIIKKKPITKLVRSNSIREGIYKKNNLSLSTCLNESTLNANPKNKTNNKINTSAYKRRVDYNKSINKKSFDEKKTKVTSIEKTLKKEYSLANYIDISATSSSINLYKSNKIIRKPKINLTKQIKIHIIDKKKTDISKLSLQDAYSEIKIKNQII